MDNVNIELFPVFSRLITVWISTGILFFFFKKYFWNSLMDFLQKREEYITSQVQSAQASNEKALAYENEAQEALKQARLDSKSMIDRSKDEANTVKQDIIEKAHAEAKDKIERAQAEIEKEKNDALADVHTQVVDIAMDAAKAIVKDNIDESKSKSIVNDFIKELNA